ncbi:MAG TPA: hypothetical protein VK691_13755 [Solirubrobacteraceae bacterium]|nr:hypothetical protein [Solirubrobacteraceae bacterium]
MGNQSSRKRRSAHTRISTAALALGAVATAAAFGTAGAGAAGPHATAARTLDLNDSASLHKQNSHGLEVKEAGTAKGTLGGPLYLQLVLHGTRSVTAQVQVYPKGGSISGDANASYHVAGATASFSGTMTITKGSGTYAKAKASALSFSGTIQRSNDAVTVHVSGPISY